MAKKLKAENAEPPMAQPGHNAQARKKIIRDVCRELVQLEGKRKEIGEKISELKNTKIKGDLGMKIADFAMAYRLYQLEGEDRDKLFDTLRETFQALGVGAQLDWIDGIGNEAAERAAMDDPASAEREGYELGKAGKNPTDGPLPITHPHYAHLMKGWERGQAENLPQPLGNGATH